MESPKHLPDDQQQQTLGSENAPGRKPPRFSLTKAYAALLTVILGIAVFLPLLTATGIFGYQVYCWAKHGIWTVIPFAEFASKVGIPPASFFTPESWLGLAKAVQTIFRLPAALILFIVSVCVALVGGVFQRR